MYVITCPDICPFYNRLNLSLLSPLYSLSQRWVSFHSLTTVSTDKVMFCPHVALCGGVNKSTCGSEDAAAVGQLVREPVPVQPRPHAGAAATTYHAMRTSTPHSMSNSRELKYDRKCQVLKDGTSFYCLVSQASQSVCC